MTLDKEKPTEIQEPVAEDSMAEMQMKLAKDQYYLVSFDVILLFNIRKKRTSYGIEWVGDLEWDSVVSRHAYFVEVPVKNYVPASHHKSLVRFCVEKYLRNELDILPEYEALWNLKDFGGDRYSEIIVSYTSPEEDEDKRVAIHLSNFIITQVHQKSLFLPHFKQIRFDGNNKPEDQDS